MSTVLEAPTVDLVYLSPKDLVPWPGLNPRTRFDDQVVRELAASIADHGILQNLVVAPAKDDSGLYWIVSGETRWRASRIAEEGDPQTGLDPTRVMVPCRVRDFTEADALKIALIENLKRESLTAIEEAKGFVRLLSLNPDWTQSRLAEEVLGDSKRQPYVANRLRLLELPAAAVDLIQAGHLQPSHARDYLLPLLRLEDDQPKIAMDRVLAQVSEVLRTEGAISGSWLETLVNRVKADVLREFGPGSLFDNATPPSTPTAEASNHSPEPGGDESVPAVASAEPTQEERKQQIEQARIELIRSALEFGGFEDWWGHVASAATDTQLRDRLHSLAVETRGEMHRVDHAGTWKMSGGGDPVVTVMPYATQQIEHLRGSRLYSLIRELYGSKVPETSEPPAATAPAPATSTPDQVEEEQGKSGAEGPAKTPAATSPSKAPSKPSAPTPAKTPAPAAAPTPPAEPTAVLPPPDAKRGELPEGAGLIVALLTATGGRPTILTVTPLPDGRVAVTVAPRTLKAGETQLARLGDPAELDAELIGAIDSHFTI